MTKPKEHPTQEELLELFTYEDGRLISRVNSGRRKIGDICGTIENNGYYRISISGRGLFKRSRLVYIMFRGDIPDDLVIDHINSIKTDDRIENLQAIRQTSNAAKAVVKAGISGFRGVRKLNVSYSARITIFGHTLHIGSYRTAEEAARAYDEAALDLFGPRFAQTNFPADNYLN